VTARDDLLARMRAAVSDHLDAAGERHAGEYGAATRPVVRERGEHGRYAAHPERTTAITIRCSPEDRDRWHARAASEGTSLAVLVRRLLETPPS